MFQKPLVDNKIPLNFLDSILSNNSLYEMFKKEFQENIDYFKGIPKSEYLFYMLEYITNKLFSGNLLQIHEDTGSSSDKTLGYIRAFFDDFIRDEVNKLDQNIFSSPFFKGLEYAKKHDEYASKNEEFLKLYEYISDTCDYDSKCKKIESELLLELEKEKLSIGEFELLCNFVKNNKNGFVKMSIVGSMLRLHAYKKNHIFDREVVKVLVYSTVRDYLIDLEEDVHIEYIDEVTFENKTYDLSKHTIYMESLLLDTFISGNYVELFSNLFFKMKLYRDELLLSKNVVSLESLHAIMNMINFKVDLSRMYADKSYEPYPYISDTKASSFVMALKFYESFGINLFMSYINSQLNNINIESDNPPTFNKEISLDISFNKSFNKLGSSLKRELIKKYDVLGIFYFDTGERKGIVDLLKTYESTSNKIITEYIESSILVPDEIIDNARDISNYTSVNSEINTLIEKLLNFIYQDLFYYSLQNIIKKESTKPTFDKEAYLDELFIKINSLESNSKLDKFIKDVLEIIEIEKQN